MSQIMQGFIFITAGAALIQMMSQLRHLRYNIVASDLQFDETRYKVKALGAGDFLIMCLVDVSKPVLEATAIHQYSYVIRGAIR